MRACSSPRRGLAGYAALLALLLTPCLFAEEALSGDLVVFHAGSLSVPFQQIADAFTEEHPGVHILREAAGSRTCARKIADLGRPCDVFGSADYTVIETLLIPEHASWCIRFATNEMAIAYTSHSHHAQDITAANWPAILLREDTAFGRSDPNADPCGYRTVLTARLAEAHYGRPGLAEALLAKDTRFIRPKETDLLALLEVRAIDYIFIYRSVAQQHELEWLALPDEINLKSPEFAETYAKAMVEITGSEPGERITKRGEPMVYGVTVPKSAPNRKAALAFTSFLLEKTKGSAIMEENGQPSIVPAPTDTFDAIPEPLKRFAQHK